MRKKSSREKKPLSAVAKGIEERGTKGALTQAAARSGKSMSEYCAAPPNLKAKQRCNMRKIFNKYRPGKKRGRKRGRGGRRTARSRSRSRR